MFLVERVSGEDGKQRLHVEVFAPGEELEQADAVGGAVGPRRGMGGTVDERADGLLPVVVFVEVFAFKIVAAGKAEEGGMQRGELLHEVDALAVRLVVVGGREKRDQREPCGPGVLRPGIRGDCRQR